MKRRDFVSGIAGALAWRSLTFAQQPGKIPRVGYLFSFARAQGEHLWEACRQGLRELGYVEGRNVVLEPRWADGHHDRMPALVAELVRLKVDVIVAAATPASLAAKAGSGAIPIVIVAVSDPSRIGLVESLAHPGGRITGLSLLTPELSGKRLSMLAEVARPIRRLAVLNNPDNSSHAVFLQETRSAASDLQIQIHSLNARNPGEIESAFQEAAREGAQALIVFDDPVLWSHRKQVVALAANARLPVMYGYSEYVDEGGLISYGPHRPDLYRRTAAYVDKILKGANPAALPIERPTRFELFVNVKAARALGLTIPQSVLLRADRVIE
jgi:putative ABC transport system substrate-binding protein